jgi:nucleotide-binding universal stress UspA family protein
MPATRALAEVQVKSILVATDFSPISEKAVRHAISIARQYGAKLYLAHVVSSFGFIIAGPDMIAHATALALEDASALEGQLVASGALGGLAHQFIVRDGDIWTELQRVAEQEHIDVIVVGTHGRTGMSKLVLGSVAERIFRQAPGLVLTVGPSSPPDAPSLPSVTPRSLLFPTDFSEASLRALPYAISLANQRRIKLVLFHVLSPVPQVIGDRWWTAGDVVQARAEAKATTRKRLERLTAAANLAIEPAFMVEFDEPAESILRAAKVLGVEFIAMGLKRRTHVETLSHLPWSTAYDVACRALCPVLTVRTENAAQ